MKMKNMSKKINWILIFILLLAFLLRVYNYKTFYVFSHDQDLASWVVKDILVNNHFRLIGQETSSKGVFIGGLFYYLQIPFYLIGKMNPLPSVFLSVILGVFSTFSLYFVINKVFNKKAAFISSLIYAASSLIVFTDREVVPTMPVMLWTVWFLYALFLVYRGKQLLGFTLFSLLVGVIWHLNLALLVLTPAIFFAFLASKKNLQLKAFVVSVITLITVNLPLLMFEVRHNFIQTKSVYLSLTTSKDLGVEATDRFAKLDRILQIASKNSINIFSMENFMKPSHFFVLLVVLLILLMKFKVLNKFWFAIFAYWQSIYIIFFTLISLNVSEYYLNGMNIVWIIVVSLALGLLINKKNLIIVYSLLAVFLYINISHILNYNSDKKGYLEKMALINEIKRDSQIHGYPCISISYITNPGYNFGYRYLFYIENMHVNNPSSGSPVYTIVYPHSLVDKIDNSFGSLGLIYPEYLKYNDNEVKNSCQGSNANLTDPMFGYVE